MAIGNVNILDYIGNTPLVDISKLSPKKSVRIFAKLESHNPTGSIKDRIAKRMILRAEKMGLLKPGQTIVEASTGNTALALAMIAKQRGYGMKAVVSTRSTPGMGELLISNGVDIIWCEPSAGMKGAIDLAQRMAREEGWYNTCQFENEENVLTHYHTTGVEIVEALPEVDVFVAGIGTGGTLMGVGRRLKENNPNTLVVGVEPKMGDPLQGLRSLAEGYMPPLLELDQLNGRFLVDSRTAFLSSREILDRTGIFAGVSSGAVLHCARRMAERMESGNVVVMFADGGWKYLMSSPWKEAAEARVDDPDNISFW